MNNKLSKLPMRQLTHCSNGPGIPPFSKLPMRQLTKFQLVQKILQFSKLPMRQLTETCLLFTFTKDF